MKKSSLRRAVLGALGAAALFGPGASSGCAVNFTPPGKVDTLRVLAVTIDRPYVPMPDPEACAADPASCTVPVTFEMEIHDAYGVATQGEERPINVLWLGGCFNPEADQYALCVGPLLQLFAEAQDELNLAVEQGMIPDFSGLPLGFGVHTPGSTQPLTFTLQVPDIVTPRPKPQFGPHYGIGYVFFLACAGRFGVLDADPSAAGSFPIGCFDPETGEQLGYESFAPGYTQIYSFADGRVNESPAIEGLTMDGAPIPAEGELPVVPPCDVPPQDRNQPPSCTREYAFDACDPYEIQLEVPAYPCSPGSTTLCSDVGEIDPEAQGSTGEALRETVWVNYYTDLGDFESDIKLVNDPQTGYIPEHEVRWIPPAEPGIATIWAVARDSRGGSNVVVRRVRVE